MARGRDDGGTTATPRRSSTFPASDRIQRSPGKDGGLSPHRCHPRRLSTGDEDQGKRTSASNDLGGGAACWWEWASSPGASLAGSMPPRASPTHTPRARHTARVHPAGPMTRRRRHARRVPAPRKWGSDVPRPLSLGCRGTAWIARQNPRREGRGPNFRPLCIVVR